MGGASTGALNEVKREGAAEAAAAEAGSCCCSDRSPLLDMKGDAAGDGSARPNPNPIQYEKKRPMKRVRIQIKMQNSTIHQFRGEYTTIQ